ncbi:ATP-binding protein [Nocardioides astragali]|uniref:ATP-binding protein n=1 Tax=Nocardioides astragali TaxID=1776736 RepID=A0ABW2N8G2_9ACTN|nr:ATP-binding protein [Nocardioides astragali]
MIRVWCEPLHLDVGTSPPLLVGRDTDLDDFREGLRGGPGSPERATLVTGLRGTGKTVMLNAYEDVAGAEGWLVISETATPNLIDRITHEHLPRLLVKSILSRPSRA